MVALSDTIPVALSRDGFQRKNVVLLHAGQICRGIPHDAAVLFAQCNFERSGPERFSDPPLGFREQAIKSS